MYQVQQCSDVYVDACVRNEAGALVFMSVFGRDTAAKEFMARIQLGNKGTDGLPELRLKGYGEDEGQQHTVFIANPRDLDKVTGRLPKCLYGNLTHLWIFDPAIRSPNRGAGQAWLIEPVRREPDGLQPSEGARDRVVERLWQAVCQLATIPLLPHWRDAVMTAIWADMVTEFGRTVRGDHNPRFSQPLGDVIAFRVDLGDDFAARVSGLICEGILTLDAPAAQLTAPVVTLAAPAPTAHALVA